MLQATAYLRSNERLASPDNQFTLVMQDDGNLVLYRTEGFGKPTHALWASGTDGQGADTFLAMQEDGNLVLYKGKPEAPTRALWQSQTPRTRASYFLNLQDDANLVVCEGTADKPKKPIWSRQTGALAGSVTSGLIESRTLFSWSDSHQIHSQELVIEPGYQALKTTMKRLDHYVRLSVLGPVDIADIGREYVNNCIDKAIKHDSTRNALEGLIAIGIDVVSEGATGGSATAAKVAEYINSVIDYAVTCLTSTHDLDEYLSAQVTGAFRASIITGSDWVYWDL